MARNSPPPLMTRPLREEFFVASQSKFPQSSFSLIINVCSKVEKRLKGSKKRSMLSCISGIARLIIPCLYFVHMYYVH